MHKRPPPSSTSFLLVKTTKKVQEETKREGPNAIAKDITAKVGGDG